MFEDFDQYSSLNENNRKTAIKDFVDTGKISLQHFKDLQELDPSRQGDKPGKLLYWIAGSVANSTPQIPVTADDAIELADWITKNEARLKGMGINTDVYSRQSPLNSYAGASELQISLGDSKSKKKDDIKSGNIKGSIVLYDGPDHKLVKVETREAMIYWANHYEKETLGNTKWCVAMESTSQYWNSYTVDSDFYVMVNLNYADHLKKIAIQKLKKGRAVWWSSMDQKQENSSIALIVSKLPIELIEAFNAKNLIPKTPKMYSGKLNDLVLQGNLDDILSAVNSMSMQSILQSDRLRQILESGWILKSTTRQLNNGNMGFWPEEGRTHTEVTINTNKNTVEVRRGAGANRYVMTTSADDLPAFYEEAFTFIETMLDRMDQRVRTKVSIEKERVAIDLRNSLKNELSNVIRENNEMFDITLNANFQLDEYITGGIIKKAIAWVSKRTKEGKAVALPKFVDRGKYLISGKGEVHVIPIDEKLSYDMAGDEENAVHRIQTDIKPIVTITADQANGSVYIRRGKIEQDDMDKVFGGTKILGFTFSDCHFPANLSLANIKIEQIEVSGCKFKDSGSTIDFGSNVFTGNLSLSTDAKLNIKLSKGSKIVIYSRVNNSEITYSGGGQVVNSDSGRQVSITNESVQIHSKRNMKYIKTFAMFEAELLSAVESKDTNKDLVSLVNELTNSDLNEGEIWDGIVAKLKSVGHDVARSAVMLAMVTSAFAGIPSEAAAAISKASGVNVEQMSHQANFTPSQAVEAMKKLEDRFYTGAGSQDQQFLKFAGNIADVVGVEPVNGYPIFKKGSPSAVSFQKAFAEHKLLKGSVDVHGKKVEGTFVLANGLYYPIVQAADAVVHDIIAVNEPAMHTGPDQTAHVADVKHGKLVDFSGILGQAAIMFKEKGGKIDGKTMERPSFTWQVIRDTFPSLKTMSDQKFEDAFGITKGKFSPKVEVDHLGVNVGQDLQKLMGN